MDSILSGNVAEDANLFPMTAQLYAYWSDLPSAPSWTDVDLMAIHRLAPFVFVADVVGAAAPYRFVYRYVGTKIVDAFGLDATGKAVEEAFESERAQRMIEAYTYVGTNGLPQLGIRRQANE